MASLSIFMQHLRNNDNLKKCTHEVSITLIPKLYKDIMRNENYKDIMRCKTPQNIDEEILNKIFSNQTDVYLSSIIFHISLVKLPSQNITDWVA